MHPSLRPTVSSSLLCLIAIFACSAPVHAADWLTVASDRVRRVELDRASILQSDAGTKVAWGRIVLSDDQAKAYGYRTVKALNRYDCRSHAFIIVTRVYLSNDETILREDKVNATAPISVKTGTVDDRFFNEVCKPASVADLRDVARKATEGIAKTEENSKPLLRRADIQLAREEQTTPTAPAMPAERLPIAPGRRVDKIPLPSTPARKPLVAMPAETPSDVSEKAATEAAATRAVRRREAAERAARMLQPTTSAAKPGALAAARAQAAMRAGSHDEALHWSYEGKAGPENWGKLDPEFSVCSNGKRQSPIDIRDGIKVDQEPIQFDYRPTFFRIVDNGHTIQINYGPGSSITVMGRTYDLIQFHFHHPAEERIDGKGFAMVAHLVHRDLEGRMAIVAVLLEAGQANSIIQTLWNNLPLEKNEDFTPRVSLQIADLLPATRNYISYIGSLTTPPCTEGVLWLVMKQPVQLSAEQINVFSRFYANNARPLQAVSGRIIKDSR